MKERGLSTELIHRGEDAPVHADSVNVPIYQTTTFLFESADEVRRYQEGKVDKYLYSRYANPTIVVTEQKIAALDRAEAALVFASGMAAASTLLLTFLRPGDELLCSAAIYGGTFHLINDVLIGLGIRVRFATLEELADPGALLGPRTRVCWVESPINPTLRCLDVARVSRACR
jgi:cystathionine beta-lyase/cystathionine gamma-synthase